MFAVRSSELGLPRRQSLTRVGRRRIGMFRPPRIGMFRGSRLGAPHAGSRWLAWRGPHPLRGGSVGSAPQIGMFCGPPFTPAVVDARDWGAKVWPCSPHSAVGDASAGGRARAPCTSSQHTVVADTCVRTGRDQGPHYEDTASHAWLNFVRKLPSRRASPS